MAKRTRRHRILDALDRIVETDLDNILGRLDKIENLAGDKVPQLSVFCDTVRGFVGILKDMVDRCRMLFQGHQDADLPDFDEFAGRFPDDVTPE